MYAGNCPKKTRRPATFLLTDFLRNLFPFLRLFYEITLLFALIIMYCAGKCKAFFHKFLKSILLFCRRNKMRIKKKADTNVSTFAFGCFRSVLRRSVFPLPCSIVEHNDHGINLQPARKHQKAEYDFRKVGK